jgi:hypothetical protein
LIVVRPLIADSAAASMNQIHTCVSNSSERGSDVRGMGLPFNVDRGDYFAANLGRSSHVSEEVQRLLLDRH